MCKPDGPQAVFFGNDSRAAMMMKLGAIWFLLTREL